MWDPGFVSWMGQTAKAGDYADIIAMTLPNPRIDFYQSSDYDVIQERVTRYANSLVSDLGFYPVDIDMPILSQMQIYSFAVLFLGLLMDIVIFMFIIISILLIYSLLMISVETKTFEIGVLRMVGLSKNGLLYMILLQAIMFVLPSVVFGFAMSFLALWAIYTQVLGSNLGFDLKPVPSLGAVLNALAVGILIPVLSSIAPIMSARSKSLSEALDYMHSKTQAVFIKILQTRKKDIGALVAFGIIAVAYGICVYYFLPLSMLSMNFSMILRIFFMILLGMLTGLTLLSLNLQRVLEYVLTYVLLFWTSKTMKVLILKNLTAHKLRNRLTSIIYSITIGFVILCIVSYQLEVKSARLLTQKEKGADFQVDAGNEGGVIYPLDVEPILAEYEDKIAAFGFITHPIKNLTNPIIEEQILSDYSGIYEVGAGLYGVTPGLYDAAFEEFVGVTKQNKSTGLGLTEQLYTARGSQSAAISDYVVDQLGIDLNDNHDTFKLTIKSTDWNVYFLMRVMFSSHLAPGFEMTNRVSGGED